MLSKPTASCHSALRWPNRLPPWRKANSWARAKPLLMLAQRCQLWCVSHRILRQPTLMSLARLCPTWALASVSNAILIPLARAQSHIDALLLSELNCEPLLRPSELGRPAVLVTEANSVLPAPPIDVVCSACGSEQLAGLRGRFAPIDASSLRTVGYGQWAHLLNPENVAICVPPGTFAQRFACSRRGVICSS